MADSVVRLTVNSQEYDQKLKRAAEGLQRYVEGCRKVGGTLEVVEKDTLEYVKALGRMETTSRSATGKLSEMRKTFVELSAQYKQLTEQEKQSPFGKELAKSLDQLKARINDSRTQLEGINKELTGSKFGQFGSVIDTVGQKFGITGNLTEMLTSKTAMLTGAIGASVAIIGKATNEWAKYNAELAKQDQITTVTTGLKDDSAKEMTDKMRALSDTYKVDFRDAINAANTLMSQFGETGENATQLIKDGMQGMIQGDGGKLLSMIQQFAPAFRDAGVSASQLVAVIQNSEGGLFTDQNMQAIVMGIRNIRLMTKATSEALAKLGIDGQEMSKKMSDGSMTVFDALKLVSRQLQTVDSNSQTAGEVMQTVFGRQGVMAGTNIAKAIEQLNTNLEETKKQTGEVGEAFAELQTANEKLNVAIREAFGYDGWEQMATGIQAKLVTALAAVIDKLGQIRQWFKDFTPEGQTQKIQTQEQKDMNRRLAYVRSGSNKSYWNQQNKQYYDQQVSERQFKVSALKGDDAITKGLRQKAEADLQAWKNLRDEYNKKANDILTAPPKSNTINNVKPTGNNNRKGGGGSGENKEITWAADSIKAQEVLVSDLRKKWNEAGAGVRDEYLAQLIEAQKKLKEMNDAEGMKRERMQGRLLLKPEDIMMPDTSNMNLAINDTLDKIRDYAKKNPVIIPITTVNDDIKKLTKTAKITADVVGSIGQAFNAIEDPAAKVAGTVAQAIASVALGYAQATTQASSMGPWAWIAFAASGLAQMLTMVSTIHSATGYAEGGIVKGNHYSGDMLDGGSFGINAGELVLNRAQQGSLASQLEGSAGGFRNGQIVGRIEGEKIVLVANRYFRRTGQGEILTWK